MGRGRRQRCSSPRRTFAQLEDQLAPRPPDGHPICGGRTAVQQSAQPCMLVNLAGQDASTQPPHAAWATHKTPPRWRAAAPPAALPPAGRAGAVCAFTPLRGPTSWPARSAAGGQVGRVPAGPTGSAQRTQHAQHTQRAQRTVTNACSSAPMSVTFTATHSPRNSALHTLPLQACSRAGRQRQAGGRAGACTCGPFMAPQPPTKQQMHAPCQSRAARAGARHTRRPPPASGASRRRAGGR